LNSRALKAGLSLCLIVLTSAIQAQWAGANDAEWKEGAVPAPPDFSTARLAPFEVSVHSELRYGLVPDSLQVGEDGVVRFVIVAQSRSGAVNVLYEGVRCKTREMRTYARWSPNRSPLPSPFTQSDGEWRTVERGDWIGLMDGPQARPAWTLARIALCEGSTLNGNPQSMLRDLRLGKPRE
jgi:hypothetical protein